MELIEDCRVLGLCHVLGPWDTLRPWNELGLWDVLGSWDVLILTNSHAKIVPTWFLPVSLIPSWAQSGHWPLTRTKRFGVWVWEQPWEKVFPLTMHFLWFYFAERKDAELVEKAAALEGNDAALAELPVILGLSAANLKILASKLSECSLPNSK
uniref:Uncharacterized protein n=1 Tax=Gallus gallus TaxID=9031 RepID=Q9YH52_CHICK|nr:unknown protein [Gallus gallus]